MRILLLSYAFSPFKGSEFSVAWNYALHMGKKHHLDIIIGLVDDHMGNFKILPEIQKEIEKKKLKVNIIPVHPNKIANVLNFLNKKNIFPYSFYFAYKYWHKQAYKKSLGLVSKNNYDLVHYQNPIGYREPGYLWKLDIPYVWGPIGGINTFNENLKSFLKLKGLIDLYLRKYSNFFNYRFNKRLKKAFARTNLLLINNSTDQITFDKYFSKKTKIFSESWISYPFKKNINSSKKLKLIWVGTLNERKGLIIFLKALSKFKFKQDILLNVVGEGNMKHSLEKFVLENRLRNVKFLGKINRDEVQYEFQNSDFSLYTSLMDANPSVNWESISNSCPVIGFDIDGIKDNLDENCSIKINIDTKPEKTIDNINTVLKNILEKREELKIYFNKNIIKSYRSNHWEQKTSQWEIFYNEAINNFKTNKYE